MSENEGGEPLTFDQVHRRYHAAVYSLIFRFVGDQDIAEDLTVETFTRLFRDWDDFNGTESHVRHRVFREAIKNIRERLRRDGKGKSLDLAGDTSVTKIQEAVDRLPPDYRNVFVMAVWHDLSYEEIGLRLGLSVPAVKTRLHRARLQMREFLSPDEEDKTD